MTTRVFVAVLAFVLILSPARAQGDPDLLGPALDRYQLGDPAGAVSKALEVAQEHPEYLKAWYLCGMVRFHDLADFPGAVECLDRVASLVEQGGVEFPEVRHVYRSRGMSYFLLGDFAKAEADLRSGIELEPDGVHGHLLWYLAARRAGREGDEVLRKYADAHESVEWPHPLVALYLGEASPEDCLAAAVVESAQKSRGNLCEAHFYLAELFLLRAEKELAATHFESCLQTGMEKYNEYLMAREELQKLAD